MSDQSIERQSRALRWLVLGRDRTQFHFHRKIYHALMGLTCFSLYAFFLSRDEALILLSLIGGTWVAFDLLRVNFPRLNTYTLLLFGKIMRRNELNSLSGNSFYIFGLMLVAFFFPKEIGLLSILFLAVGDPAAALVGTAFGHHKLFGKKSLEGSLGCFIACFVAAFFYFALYMSLELGDVLLLSCFGAIAGTISETLPLPMDDNFTIPVVSSLFLSLLLPFLTY